MLLSPPADPAAVRQQRSRTLTPGRSLGLALARRAEECCGLTNERLRSHPWAGREPSPAYSSRVRGINRFATLLIARWIAYGIRVTDDEMHYISERGDLAASEQLSIVNITRAYLIWRDTVIEILSEEAARLETPAEVLAAAVRSLRASSDAGLIQVARAFDSRLHGLARDLDFEREALLHLALHDPLTGLPNRMLLHDRINQAAFAAKRADATFALLVVDLDGFKKVNDTFGHRIGDMVLKRTSARLVDAIRETDTVARLGGDEFVVVLLDVDGRAAGRTATTLRDILEQPATIEGVEVRVGASFGLAMYPSDGLDVHTLLSTADQAMYRTKRADAHQTV